ncbi:MAG TPA: ABC transporter permease [Thermoanaerobaculia bacterium]|nr:ABC transporter permease [Thermoanaerobaculia bacterium]
MNTFTIHYKEAKYEFLKLVRMPGYALPTLAFPVLFYLFFGVAFGSRNGSTETAKYLLATYGAFGVMGACLFGFGVTVANERGLGWLQVKRTTPMPVSAYFVAKTVMAMLFSAIIVLLLFTTGTLLGHVQITFAQMASMFAILIPGSIVFCAIGLTIGCFASSNAAPAIVNLIYLPLSFLSGLWVPIWMLPKPLQTVAFCLPPYHLAQLALRVIGFTRGGRSVGTHVLMLAIALALFTTTAVLGYRRGENA